MPMDEAIRSQKGGNNNSGRPMVSPAQPFLDPGGRPEICKERRTIAMGSFSVVIRERASERERMKKEETVKLISAEGFEFVIAKEAAMVSHTIRNMLTSPG